MYAIAIIRYRRPIDEVAAAQDAHRAWARELKEQGVLLASGPLDPRFGGAFLVRVPDDGALAALDRLRDADPYVRAGVGQWEILPWNVGVGREDLDAAFPAR